MNRITIATIDNHEIIRDGLVGRLAGDTDDLRVVASHASIDEWRTAATPVDVVLLDLMLNEGDSSDHIPEIVATGARVLIYTNEERPVPLRRAVIRGASGVLLKSDPPASMIEPIRTVAGGGFSCSGSLAHALLHESDTVADLSPRQVDVLRALDEGLDYRQTARALAISEGAVRTHLQRIRDKFRSIGVEPGNAHHLTHLATEQGHLR